MKYLNSKKININKKVKERLPKTIARQTSLFKTLSSSAQRELKARRTHGGQSHRWQRKLKRPLAPGKWTHLVLKSKKASGKLSLMSPKNKIFIEQLLARKSHQHHVKLANCVNMGNHLHLKLKYSHAKHFQAFLRSISGLIARHVTQARRGQKFGQFWDGLAFTRILTSSFEALQLDGYFEANRFERDISSSTREAYLNDLNQWMRKLRRWPSRVSPPEKWVSC